MLGPDGWWRRIVLRAEFWPQDTVLVGNASITAQDFIGDGPVLRFLHWTGLVLWLLFALPFALGLAVVGLKVGGVPLPFPAEEMPFTTPGQAAWRIPTGLFMLAMAAAAAYQWLTGVAYLRYRWRTRRGRR